MGQPTLTQTHWAYSADDNADPDSNSYTIDTPLTVTKLSTAFILRFQVAESNGYDEANTYGRVYYDQTSNFSGSPIQVTQNTTVIAISAGTITEAANVSTDLLGEQVQTWANGYSVDVSDQTPKHTISANNYSEYCFCMEFQADAANANYYFRFYSAAQPMDVYAAPGASKVVLNVAVAGTTLSLLNTILR